MFITMLPVRLVIIQLILEISQYRGPFTGMKVNAFLAFAETAIGRGFEWFTFSQINDAATAINENFDNGTVDKGFDLW